MFKHRSVIGVGERCYIFILTDITLEFLVIFSFKSLLGKKKSVISTSIFHKKTKMIRALLYSHLLTNRPWKKKALATFRALLKIALVDGFPLPAKFQEKMHTSLSLGLRDMVQQRAGRKHALTWGSRSVVHLLPSEDLQLKMWHYPGSCSVNTGQRRKKPVNEVSVKELNN